MSTTTFFFIVIPILASLLLVINLIFSPHNSYIEKDSAFECGFHSFPHQNRTQFSVSFFIFGLLFFVFELGKNALKISSKQNQLTNNSIIYPILFDSSDNKQKSSNKRFGSKRSFIIR